MSRLMLRRAEFDTPATPYFTPHHECVPASRPWRRRAGAADMMLALADARYAARDDGELPLPRR